MATNSECEVWLDGAWRVVSVDTARAYPELVKRCVECGGPIRLHKAGPSNIPRAHAEHQPGHDGCSLGHYFSGRKSRHPIQVTQPSKPSDVAPQFSEEIIAPVEYVEGATVSIHVNSFERDPRARAACLRYYGRKCFICGFSFGDAYGEEAEKIIHVHHVKPLSQIRTSYSVDPINDLRPVCPNCHAVIHSKTEAYEIGEVRSMLEKAKRDLTGGSSRRLRHRRVRD